jgi:hypothetical protein
MACGPVEVLGLALGVGLMYNVFIVMDMEVPVLYEAARWRQMGHVVAVDKCTTEMALTRSASLFDTVNVDR